MVLFKKMFANQLSKSYVWRDVVHQLARWTLDVQGLVRVLASFFFQERDFTLPMPLSGNE